MFDEKFTIEELGHTINFWPDEYRGMGKLLIERLEEARTKISKLENDRDFYEDCNAENFVNAEKLRRSLAATKGYITRIKNQGRLK